MRTLLTSLLLCSLPLVAAAQEPSAEARRRTAAALRASLRPLAPHLAVAWHMPLRIRTSRLWLDRQDLLVEGARHRLWAVERASGRTRFTFALRVGSSRRTFSITRRPARSANRLYLLGTSHLFVLDHAGNLESYAALDFVPSSDPVATDSDLFCGTQRRFFYGYDHGNKQYRRRRRLEGRALARPVLERGRVYYASNDPGKMRVTALSTEGRSFFRTVWNKRVYDTVSAPLTLHPGGAGLYVGTEHGTLLCYDKHSGEILWFTETEGRIRQAPLARGDRVYVVAEDGDRPGLVCVKAVDPKGGTASNTLWRFARGKQVLALGKTRVYVRTARQGRPAIAVLRARDGELLAEHPIDRRFTFTPTNRTDGRLFLGTRDGDLFSLKEES